MVTEEDELQRESLEPLRDQSLAVGEWMSGAPGLHSGGRGNTLDDLTWLWQAAVCLTSPL